MRNGEQLPFGREVKSLESSVSEEVVLCVENLDPSLLGNILNRKLEARIPYISFQHLVNIGSSPTIPSLRRTPKT